MPKDMFIVWTHLKQEPLKCANDGEMEEREKLNELSTIKRRNWRHEGEEE